jgi:NAD(P)H-hydrate epimerase
MVRRGTLVAVQPVLTAAQTQALDRETEARGIPVAELMERAGLAVARAAMALAGGGYGRRAVVVAGKGNNGGDGLVAARYLSLWGMGVTVVLLPSPEDLHGPAAENLDRLHGTRARVVPFAEAVLSRELSRADVTVDAIFGTGFRGAPRDAYSDAIAGLDGRPVVSIDIPSGLEADTGLHFGPVVWADVTVTFGALKLGHVLYPGALYSGRVEVVDIGFPPELLRGGDLWAWEPDDVGSVLEEREREPWGEKRASGVVLAIGGSRTMTGAPRLMAMGAYRAGAGLVTLGVPAGVLPVVQSSLTEATFLPLEETFDGAVAEEAWDQLAERLKPFGAVAAGPGLSGAESTVAFVRRLVRECPLPLVLDADGLNAMGGHAAEIGEREAPTVITPHHREFARLFGLPETDVADDPIGLARKAAVDTGSVVLLKGARSVVAAPDGEVYVNTTGSPALASGGTGDVLTGMIAAYLARGHTPREATAAAAFVHGLAGQIAGERLGEGTMAADVAAAIPEAVRRVREEGG